MIFSACAEGPAQLGMILTLADSIRTFAGSSSGSTIRAYLPEKFPPIDADAQSKIDAMGVEIRRSSAPEESLGFFFARKVFAAAQAEGDAVGHTDVLVWMDEDTIVLQEPRALQLAPEISFGYRPVMHNRSGSLLAGKPDAYWSRIYEVLAVPEESFFPMVTVADRQTIRPYFNAGLLAVRPERGLLRRWADCFRALYGDPQLAAMCRQEPVRNIFLFQAALAGAALLLLKRGEMAELPATCNYPLLFDALYPSAGAFASLEGVVTLRYEVLFDAPVRGWPERVTGPPDRLAWLVERLGGPA